MWRTQLTPMPFTALVIGCLVDFDRLLGARRQNVLPAGRGGIVVVDDDDHAVVLVEHRVADRRRQSIVPEAAIADEGNGSTLCLGRIERRSGRRSQTVSHGRRAQFEGRHDRKQMAANVRSRCDACRVPVRRAWSPRRSAAPDSRCRSPAAGSARPSTDREARWSPVCSAREPSAGSRLGRLLRGMNFVMPVEHHLAGIFAGHGQHVLAGEPGCRARPCGAWRRRPVRHSRAGLPRQPAPRPCLRRSRRTRRRSAGR